MKNILMSPVCFFVGHDINPEESIVKETMRDNTISSLIKVIINIIPHLILLRKTLFSLLAIAVAVEMNLDFASDASIFSCHNKNFLQS